MRAAAIAAANERSERQTRSARESAGPYASTRARSGPDTSSGVRWTTPESESAPARESSPAAQRSAPIPPAMQGSLPDVNRAAPALPTSGARSSDVPAWVQKPGDPTFRLPQGPPPRILKRGENLTGGRTPWKLMPERSLHFHGQANGY
ncbi:hypothetical protein PIIN_11283 [Serendipita indica DSM 11827]|uniref:Uncharacterized protein n=1 Tax=Serendipita indica (strain DSM 11827) TaxID=1109443 RepID=G4U163_SERID|nr:hypothetical protein PIIN_11283 [Serendipita indica DSM 11827]